MQGVYLADGVDKVFYTDGRGIGVRSDYNGVLLLDTILQTPVFRNEDVIKLELLLSEAILLYQCLRCIELPGVDHLQEVLQELSSKIHTGHVNQKKGVKAQKVNIFKYLFRYLIFYKVFFVIFNLIFLFSVEHNMFGIATWSFETCVLWISNGIEEAKQAYPCLAHCISDKRKTQRPFAMSRP